MVRSSSSATGSAVRVEPATIAGARAVVESSSGRSLARRFWRAGDISAADVLARYERFLMPCEPERPAWVLQWGESPAGLLNLVVIAEHTAEAAVLVADPWQGKGLASRLVSAVFRSPGWAGWSIQALVQPDNAPARRLLGRVGSERPRLVGVGPGQLDFVVDIPSRA